MWTKAIDRLIVIDWFTWVCGFKSLLLGIFVKLSQPSMWIISSKPHAIPDIDIMHNLHRHQKTNIDTKKTNIDITTISIDTKKQT